MYKNNQVFAAPMAGITDRPFRQILRKFAPKACLVTEMISCHSIVAGHKNCIRNFDGYAKEGPIGAQIFGADAKLMARAAKILEAQGAGWIDINMGCPVPKVATRAGAGSFLMRDHELAGQIINAVASAVKIPVSVKSRLGWDDKSINWQDLVKVAENNGAAFFAIHGRTRAQGYSGNAVLLEKPNEFKIPVMANGDIQSKDDAGKYKELGYDGVLIGRALMGKPWLLGQLSGEYNQDIKNIKDIVLEHLELVIEYYGAAKGIPLFRKHASWYSSGMDNSALFRIKANQTLDAQELKRIIDEFFN